VSDDGPKIVELGVSNPLQGDIESFRRKIPVLIEYAQLQAKLRRASYLAHVEAGFTEVQALDLCKT
jgi:hypothetical protein